MHYIILYCNIIYITNIIWFKINTPKLEERFADSKPDPMLAGWRYKLVRLCSRPNRHGNKEIKEKKRERGGEGREGGGGGWQWSLEGHGGL